MSNITEILSGFRPIDLAEMDGVQLMNRTDTKFILGKKELLEILPDLLSQYRVLEVANVRESRYATLYYDTPEFYHFLQHQNGKKHRFKIRKREYVESNLAFLEIKEKSNKGRTFKSRVKIKLLDEMIDEKAKTFIENKAMMTDGLEAKLWNNFTRTTLVDTVAGERVTLDTNVEFHYNGKNISLPDLVIAEVKQDGANRHSRFIQHMKNRLIRPEGISKYCLGVALLYKNVKSNMFKEKILRIQKIKS